MSGQLQNGEQQFFDNNGKPLNGGTIDFYVPNTTTRKTTWQDQALTIQNTNPIILDAGGRAIIWGSGSYRQVLKDNHGNLIWDQVVADPIVSLSVPTGASQVGADDGTGGSIFTNVAGFITTLAANIGSSLVGFIQSGNNAVKRTVQSKLRDTFSVKDFGAVGDGVADDTSAIQAAINAASNSQVRTIVFPAGIYNFTKLYCYYDAALNPGYNVNRNGELTFKGDGISPENGGSCGTVLNTTLTTGDALNVGSAANDTTPYNTRDFIARDISFQGGTSGSLVLARGVVSARFEGCQFVQSNAAGTGLWATTNYFGVIEKCRFKNTAVGTKTGDAVKFGTTITAGLFTMRDCNISGYLNGLNMYAGQWQLLSIEDSEITGTAGGYGIYVNGITQIMNLEAVYFEGVCVSFIADNASNKIQNLNMFGCWMLGSGLTAQAVFLSGPNSVQIIGGYSQDQNTSFLNIAAAPSGGTSAYAIHGFNFPRTGPAPSAVTLFTTIIPALYGVDYASADPNVSLVPVNSKPILSRPNYASSSYICAGHSFGTSLRDYGAVAGGSLDLQADGFIGWAKAFCVTSDTIVYLPTIGSGIPHGYDCTVTNTDASTNNLVVKTAIADGAATVATVKPGGQRLFKFFRDTTATGWK